MDSREHIFPIRAGSEKAPNIAHPSIGMEGDVARSIPAPQNHGHHIPRGAMGGDRLGEGEGGHDVPVAGEKGSAPGKKVLHVFEASAGVEENGFVAEGERERPMATFGEGLHPLAGGVVGIHDHLAHTERGEMVEREGDERPSMNGEERLRDAVGERAEASAEPGAKDECTADGWDLGHGGSIGETGRGENHKEEGATDPAVAGSVALRIRAFFRAG